MAQQKAWSIQTAFDNHLFCFLALIPTFVVNPKLRWSSTNELFLLFAASINSRHQQLSLTFLNMWHPPSKAQKLSKELSDKTNSKWGWKECKSIIFKNWRYSCLIASLAQSKWESYRKSREISWFENGFHFLEFSFNFSWQLVLNNPIKG